MGELVIQYHDFENAKKEIKKFSEQTTTDLDLKRVDDSKGVGEFLGDWFFGRGIGKDHLVKGEELNDLTSQIQTHLHSINNTQIKLIKEFGQVYSALEALDKDYIQAILVSVKATEETSEGIQKTQEQIKKIVDNRYVHLVFFAVLGVLSIYLTKFFPMNSILLVIVRTLFSMFFVYLGFFYTQFIKDRHDIFTAKCLGFVICLQAVLWLFNTDYDPVQGIGLSYILVWGQFNTAGIVPLLTSLTGIWASLFVVKILYPYLKDIKFLQYMGNVTYHIMANHLFVMYLLTVFLLWVNGVPISEKSNHDICWIFDPVKNTYLYFVVTMVVTTYLGVGLKRMKDYIFNHIAS